MQPAGSVCQRFPPRVLPFLKFVLLKFLARQNVTGVTEFLTTGAQLQLRRFSGVKLEQIFLQCLMASSGFDPSHQTPAPPSVF